MRDLREILGAGPRPGSKFIGTRPTPQALSFPRSVCSSWACTCAALSDPIRMDLKSNIIS